MPKGSLPRSRSGRIMDYLVNRSNIGKPVRSWKKLMDNPPSLTGPIRDEDVERVFDVGSAVAGGSTAFARPKGSLGTGARPFKVRGAEPRVKVTQPKPGTKKFIGPVKEAPKNKTKAEVISEGKKSSSSYKVGGAQQNYTGPKPKPGSSKFIGPTRATQPGEKGFIGPTRPPRAGEKDFIGPVSASVKGSSRGMGRAYKAGAAAGAGALGYVGYKSQANKGSAQAPAPAKGDKGVVNRREGGGGMTASAKTDRGGSKPQSFKDKMQGRNWKGGAKPAPKVERKAEGRKPEKRKIGFKGNWVGAAPTAMQARGGVRRTKAENLRRLFRER